MSTVHAALELIESVSTAVDNTKNSALECSLTLKRFLTLWIMTYLLRNYSFMELEGLQMHG